MAASGLLPQISPHSFRHTFVTIAINSGAPPQYVQRLVRHKNLQTTMSYYDKSVDYLHQAAAAHPYFNFKSQTA